LDTPPGLNAQQAKEWRSFLNFDSSYAALYYPWIEVADLSGSGKTTKLVPPSGHIAGNYNRSDSERGVHKAPANEVVLGALNLEINLSKGEQDTLNPIGVNCIRSFPGRGIRVWGGRTLSSDGSWRYINVRRLFIMVGASLDAGMQWVVFEPNDSTLWAKVRRDVTAFLRTIWRSGALFGTTPEQAFYVKCDEEVNPPEIRDLGQLIIEIGLAPVKPAEFVIFRISQWAGADAEA
jgi:phage tail sheath protein FI